MENLFGPSAIGQMLMTLISFILVIYVAYRFGYKPISEMLEKRQAVITKDLAEAQMAQTTSQQAQEDARLALEQARQEATEIINRAKVQSQAEAQRTIQATESEMRELKARQEASFAQERQEMQEAMEANIAEISVQIAEKILQREVTQEDQDRLIQEFMARLEAEGNV